MNLQTLRNRKKLQQSGTMMDALILEKLYGQVESIVKDEFAKNQTALYKKLDADYKKSQELLDKKCKELEKLLENKGEVTKKDISDALLEVQQLKSDMQTRQQTIIDQFTAQKDQVVKLTEQKATEILQNVDKKQGPQGIQGKPGTNGSPDTAKEVVEKVNKAKGVNMTAVEGLLEKLETIKKLARGGGKSGGGMGNAVDFTRPVSSSTTTITLPYRPAANGKALWLYYNGQWIQPTVHYTVSGITVSLTFTPADGTTIEGLLIR